MRRTNTDDTAILNLAQRWAPYGRVPTGEIWVTFGMNSTQFYAALTRILGTLTARDLAPDQRRSLEQLVVRHIRPPATGRRPLHPLGTEVVE
ncbi:MULTISPECIES: hypothetical protein [unclassified Rhodococcus (in: high G+C Gram-positive bacteria)]|uniref:hypothetical protein n=1 Tax=unclassified Rhodococcus (in: high G+C Gram-positive bacteria) TaxID=192944 RepID=UPI00163A7519|nr:MULTISPECIES: hypothetical protein [unclassified Rhodococcus (in: high G+C Gram-positive bacteria)]MBC2640718.1 hypothetical protein [Rhodococcus sp. 3A]MBC2894537.1 hypothetical protein [Rhodococcus sp. 4CII]